MKRVNAFNRRGAKTLRVALCVSASLRFENNFRLPLQKFLLIFYGMGEKVASEGN